MNVEHLTSRSELVVEHDDLDRENVDLNRSFSLSITCDSQCLSVIPIFQAALLVAYRVLLGLHVLTRSCTHDGIACQSVYLIACSENRTQEFGCPFSCPFCLLRRSETGELPDSLRLCFEL